MTALPTVRTDAVGTSRDSLELLDELQPIGLDELVAEAALLARVDRKYVVPVAALPILLAAAPTSTRVLEIAGRRTFGYRSTYLDTPERLSYLAAGRRRRRRFKVRTRAYLDTGGCWLEVKTRRGRDLTVKERIQHHDAGLAPLTATGRAFVGERLAGAGMEIDPSVLEPVLDTAYRRTTLLLPGSRSRVTLDTDLGWTALTGATRGDLDRPSLAVIETKTVSAPSAFDRVLWAHGHRPVPISKYGVGLAALHPDLPRLKWHRVLTRDLHVARP